MKYSKFCITGEQSKLCKASPFPFPLCNGTACSLSSQNKKYHLYLAFLLTRSPLLMRFACEHTFCFLLELVCSSPVCSRAVYHSKLQQRAKMSRSAGRTKSRSAGRQRVVAKSLLTSKPSQGSVSPLPRRWEGKQYHFLIKDVTKPPHTGGYCGCHASCFWLLEICYYLSVKVEELISVSSASCGKARS